MDWKGIMGSVIGAIILGALAFVFNTLGDLKHNDDVQNTKMVQSDSEQDDLWNKYNILIERVHKLEIAQKDSEIERLKEKLNEK